MRDEGPKLSAQGAVRDDSMSVERRQGGAYQGDLFDEALLKALRLVDEAAVFG